MFRKKTGLICIVAAAFAIAAYAQTTKPKARSTNLQGANQGYLGAGVLTPNPDDVRQLNLKDNSGVVVSSITPGTAATAAGLHKNDVILEIDGQRVKSAEDFINSILGKSPGTRINLTIWRNSARQNLVATLGTRPPDLPLQEPAGPPVPMSPQDLAGMAAAMGAAVAPRLGFWNVELMPQLAEYFGVMGGVLVESVEPRTPAEKAGLKAGDIVTKVNGIPVSNEREIYIVVRQTGKKQVVFTVMRNKKEVTLSMELSWNYDDRQPLN